MHGVFLHAGRTHPELDAGEVVVMRVEEDREPSASATTSRRASRRTMRAGSLSCSRARDVDRVVVVGEPQLGLLAGRLAFLGQALDEAGDQSRLLPRDVVEPSVDADGDRRAAGVEGRAILGGNHRRRQQQQPTITMARRHDGTKDGRIRATR